MYRHPPKKTVATRENLEDLLKPWPMNRQIADVDKNRIRESAFPCLLNQLEEATDGKDVCTAKPGKDGVNAWERAIETLALRSLPQTKLNPPNWGALDLSALESQSEPGLEWEIIPSELDAFERMEAMKSRLEVEFDRTDPSDLLRSTPCRPLKDVKGADELIFDKTKVAEGLDGAGIREDVRCKDKRKLVYPPLPDQLPIPRQWRRPPPKLVPLAQKRRPIMHEHREEEN